MNTVRRNPLLSRPPQAFHRLQNTRLFRKLLGRPPRQDDYDGVHTANEKVIAAAYAIGSWNQQVQGADPNSVYPVIVTLDVSGLDPLPDVDAMLKGAEAADVMRGEFRSMRGEGRDFWEILNETDYTETEANAGDHPASFIFEDMGRNVALAIEGYAEDIGADPQDVLDTFVDTGELPAAVLTRLVGQQRYLVDFDLDRVVRIEAVKPWWHRVEYDHDDDDAERASSLGWHVFTLGDIPFDEGETKVIYQAPDAADRTDVEYHGTTSATIEAAFGEIIPAETPFHVSSEGNDEP